MELEKMKQCPYCGEDIPESAKKCMHCREWLDEEDDTPTEKPNEPLDEFEQDNNDSHMNTILKILGVILIVVVAFFTCPSKEKQREKMIEELRVEMRKELKHKHKPIPSEKKLDKMIEKRWDLYLDNYGIFTLGRVGEADTGEKEFFSIGAFGIVYVRNLVLL